MHTSYMMCNCCLKDKQYDLRFLRFCKRATLQFCFLKPPLAITTIILAVKDKYHEGNWSPVEGYFLFVSVKIKNSFRIFVYLYYLQYIGLFGSICPCCVLCCDCGHSSTFWSNFEIFLCEGKHFFLIHNSFQRFIYFFYKSFFSPSFFSHSGRV